jgi:hypothetical protein
VKERVYLENVDIDGRLILKWILNERIKGNRVYSCGAGQRLEAGYCYGTEILGFIKCIEFYG